MLHNKTLILTEILSAWVFDGRPQTNKTNKIKAGLSSSW